jgi:magnesium transporter
MNEVMKVLSVFATIALPMTVISGIYGTNFTNLPGSRYAYGFWIMITIMFLFSLLMVYMFKKRGWF